MVHCCSILGHPHPLSCHGVHIHHVHNDESIHGGNNRAQPPSCHGVHIHHIHVHSRESSHGGNIRAQQQPQLRLQLLSCHGVHNRHIHVHSRESIHGGNIQAQHQLQLQPRLQPPSYHVHIHGDRIHHIHVHSHGCSILAQQQLHRGGQEKQQPGDSCSCWSQLQ